MRKAYLLITAFLIITYSNTIAQQVNALKANITYDIDNLGDGHLVMSMTYNASQWDNWKRAMGSNSEALIKRNVERAYPAYYLQNFVYKEDAMNRTWTLTFDALGLARINDDGQWQIPINVKNPDVTKISDVNYAMTATYQSGGMLEQDMIKINIPGGASDIKQTKDAFGKPIFTYALAPGHKGFSFIFLGLGILLIAAGIVFFLKPDILSSVSHHKAKPFTVVTAAPQAPPAAASNELPANPNIEKQA